MHPDPSYLQFQMYNFRFLPQLQSGLMPDIHFLLYIKDKNPHTCHECIIVSDYPCCFICILTSQFILILNLIWIYACLRWLSGKIKTVSIDFTFLIMISNTIRNLNRFYIDISCCFRFKITTLRHLISHFICIDGFRYITA